MNESIAPKNAPNPVQFIFSPVQSARSIITTGKGMAWVIGIWALDYFFQAPFTVSRWLLRASESPVSGLTTLWSFFVNASLLPAGLAALLGIVLYYQKRRGPQPWDLWNSIVVAGYCFTPHTLLIALSALVAYSGFDSPWLLHHRNSADTISDIQMLIRMAPVLAYAWICLKEKETALLITSHQSLRLIPIVLVLSALAATGHHISSNLEQARPLMKGDPLPSFAIYDSSGQQRILNQTQGKVILVDVWATWCGPCVAAMPHLEELHQQYQDDGLELISLNVEPERSQYVLQFIKDKDLSFPVYFDRGQARQSLMVNLYPTLILIDTEAKIDSIYNGTLGLAGLEGDIQRLLNQ